MACQTAWLQWPEDQVPTATMRWTLQTETSLCKDPDPAVAGDVKIDWMAVWRPA